jgi:hypothetical protein
MYACSPLSQDSRSSRSFAAATTRTVLTGAYMLLMSGADGGMGLAAMLGV